MLGKRCVCVHVYIYMCINTHTHTHTHTHRTLCNIWAIHGQTAHVRAISHGLCRQVQSLLRMNSFIWIAIFNHELIWIRWRVCSFHIVFVSKSTVYYRVATISRLLQIISLFCRIAIFIYELIWINVCVCSCQTAFVGKCTVHHKVQSVLQNILCLIGLFCKKDL